MLALLGAAIVLGSTLGGFMLAGGKPLVLLHVSEFVVILGVAAGVLVIASPGHVMKEILHKIKFVLTGKSPSKADYFDLLKLLYEVLMLGRRNGLIALEEHVMDPQKSSVFTKYPSLLNHPDRLNFLCNSLKPIIDGKIKPDPSTLSTSSIWWATPCPESELSRRFSASSIQWLESPTAPRWSASASQPRLQERCLESSPPTAS